MEPPFSKIKYFFRNKICMIPEKVIGFNPIFIIQVTSLIYKKGMNILYESLSIMAQIKEKLAKANFTIQGYKKKTTSKELWHTAYIQY